MEWKRHGAGLVSGIELSDGRTGKVVLIGGRDNPKGAMLVLPSEGEESAKAFPIAEVAGVFHPSQLVEVLCAQERAFGGSGLNPIETS
ncbi:MAG: hypothetical protein IT365_12545 [Candidatus Hydrogenedentes bacterium]|nr:hypothetical protein [Candidatus Hydrogenedentota bacterium]